MPGGNTRDFTLVPDPSAPIPLHRQIYDGIRQAILGGRLRPGDRLPATRALAERLVLSRATVAEAYDQLQAEGYLQARHGSGTFVASTIPEDALQPSTRESPGTRVRIRTPRLSSWGEQATSTEYRRVFGPSGGDGFPFDFRPHRIAVDHFPWDDWRSAVERAMNRERSSVMATPPPAGHQPLLEAIAGHVATYRAVRCSAEQIVIVNGTQQGLNLLAQLLLEAGDHVVVEDPGYPTARLALEARGLQVTRVPVDAEGIVVNSLHDLPPYRLVHVTPSHQEPTGATLSLSRRLALLELAERTGAVVVEDDYDSEFRYEGRPVESLQGLDRSGLVVYAGTFSKSVLPGLRIGFLVLPPALVEPLVAAKSLWDSGSPMLEQAALAEFMRTGDFARHIRRMRRLYRTRRDVLVETLDAAFGNEVQVGARHGGLNVLVSFDLPLTAAALIERVSAAGIGLRSAAQYYAATPERPTFLMGFAGLREEDIVEGVQRLAQAVA